MRWICTDLFKKNWQTASKERGIDKGQQNSEKQHQGKVPVPNPEKGYEIEQPAAQQTHFSPNQHFINDQSPQFNGFIKTGKCDCYGLCPNAFGKTQYDRDEEGDKNKFIYGPIELLCNKGAGKSAGNVEKQIGKS